MEPIWIQGGPLLEICFVLPNVAPDDELLALILHQFETFGFVSNHETYLFLIATYVKGYPCDAETPSEKWCNSTKFSFNYSIAGERVATVYIDKLSSQLTKVKIAFYDGDGLDSEESGQKGIKKEERELFHDLFKQLFNHFEFPAGTIGIENGCLDLFKVTETFPDEKFNLKNLDLTQIQDNDISEVIIAQHFMADIMAIPSGK